MREAKKHEARGHRLDWFVLLIICIVGYFSYTVLAQQMHLNEVDRDYEAATQRLQAAQQANETLKAQKMELEDPVYVEKVAREELGMTKQGELPYISAKK